uniref:Uncharacterized protein n=1 Tax=Solanum tuberosum TaxID=4113 RepID=M1DQL6_SOLTU
MVAISCVTYFGSVYISIGIPLKYNDVNVNELHDGMEAKHRVDMASGIPLTVWGYMTPDSMSSLHGLCRFNAYSHHMRWALWFLDEFYEVWVVVWDDIHALH